MLCYVYIFYILASQLVLMEGELFAELVQDDEGQAEAQHEVRTRQVKNKDVPSCPHGLVGDHSRHDDQVITNQNCTFNIFGKNDSSFLNYCTCEGCDNGIDYNEASFATTVQDIIVLKEQKD